MNSKNFRSILIAALCALLAALSAADEPASTPPAEPAAPSSPAPKKKPEPVGKVSEDILVSATRSERSAADVPVSATVISDRQIAASPTHTVDDVLRNVPGLVLPTTSSTVVYPTSNTISMRGLGGSRALVLFDGIPLIDPFAGYVQWNRVPLLTVERFEIVRGGAASLFGNYAMGGLVNILSHPADENRLDAEASYGSNATRELNVSFDQLVGASTGFGVDVNTFDTDGYFRTPEEQRGKIDIPFASRNRVFGLHLDHTDASGLTTYARASYWRNHLSQGTELSYDERESYDFSAGARKTEVFGGELAANAFGERQTFFVQNTVLPADGSRDEEFVNNRHHTPIRSLGGSVQWTRSYSTTFPIFIVGLDVQNLMGEDRGETFSNAGQLVRTRNSGGRQNFAGLFTEADLFPVAGLEVLASVRLDAWWNYNGHQITQPGASVSYADVRTTQVDPRLSLRYDLGGGLAIRGAGYRAFHAPTLNDLYRTTQTKTFVQNGNPNLGPEFLVGGDVGVEAAGPIWSAQLNLFTNQVNDLISRVPIATKPTLIYQTANIGSTRSRGIELFGRVLLGGPWSLTANATLTDARIVSNPPDPTLEGNLVPGVARRFGSLAVEYASRDGWTATLRGRTLSRRYDDAANQLPLDATSIFDLQISYAVTRDLEARFSVENLLDREYVSDSLVGPRFGAPRQYFFGLRFQTSPGSSASPSAASERSR